MHALTDSFTVRTAHGNKGVSQKNMLLKNQLLFRYFVRKVVNDLYFNNFVFIVVILNMKTFQEVPWCRDIDARNWGRKLG